MRESVRCDKWEEQARVRNARLGVAQSARELTGLMDELTDLSSPASSYADDMMRALAASVVELKTAEQSCRKPLASLR